MTSLFDIVAGGVEVVDLGRPYRIGMPQSPNHPPYWHALPRRHGDMVRADGGSAANDMIVLGTHVGTHVDALAHVSHDGLLHGGLDATEECVGGRFMTLGAHTIPPMVTTGILLDVAAALGAPDGLPAGYEITPEDLDATARAQRVDPGTARVLLVRSGWGRHFDDADPATYVGRDSGVPGVGEAGARWLAAHAPLAVGADTIAFERLAPGAGHGLLPAHRVLLVEHGVYLMEALDLEALAARGAHRFVFAFAPLNLVGATGAPVRPLAVLEP